MIIRYEIHKVKNVIRKIQGKPKEHFMANSKEAEKLLKKFWK